MQKGWKANWLNYFRGRTRPRSLFKRGRGKKRKESRNACSIIISPRGEPPWHSWQTTCLWSGLHDFDDRDIWHSSRFWHSSPTLVPTTTDSPFAIFPLATNGDDRLHFVYMSMDGHLYTYIYIYIRVSSFHADRIIWQEEGNRKIRFLLRVLLLFVPSSKKINRRS